MKTSELTGKALRFAIAKAQGWVEKLGEREIMLMIECDDFAYDTDWGVGGPLIESEQLGIGKEWIGEAWLASAHDINAPVFVGPTPLIAAMRAFVASRLGDEVEIPEELR